MLHQPKRRPRGEEITPPPARRSSCARDQRRLFNRRGGGETRVGHEYVEPAKLPCAGVESRLDLGFVGDVAELGVG